MPLVGGWPAARENTKALSQVHHLPGSAFCVSDHAISSSYFVNESANYNTLFS